MYKIMIVEDEKIERDHLVRVIESLKLPLQAVLTATNGEEGITIFNRYHPDIIIADINMPIMDGLTMIELVKQRNPDTVCFILSSYNYFTYAQKALRLGVIDFILKHFTSLIFPDIVDYCIILSPLFICLLFLLTLPDSGRLTLE